MERLKTAQKSIKEKGIYYHHKNPKKLYRILHLAIDESTDTVSVVYQALYGKKIIFIRSLDSFLTPGKFMLKSAKLNV